MLNRNATSFIKFSRFENVNPTLMSSLQKHYINFLQEVYDFDLPSDMTRVQNAHREASKQYANASNHKSLKTSMSYLQVLIKNQSEQKDPN